MIGDVLEYPGILALSKGRERLLAQWSAAGSVASVETEYFGASAHNEPLSGLMGNRLGPLDEQKRKRFSRVISPISQALRRLG
ncbi:hypothetical protein [Streptomyces lydicus]|uniref:hypothetical protein n=1 Tax=Streptomyces lydicus TaxID=47763 RepID=UPI002870ACC6|nr:hypothetical protein [Streptomyces lydicus]